MSYPSRPHLVADSFVHLAQHARLPLAADRHEPVAAMLAGALSLIDKLDELDLAEVPPATAFDARWE